MNKIIDSRLNETKISLDSLKSAKIGDEVVVMTTDGHVTWYEVIYRKGIPGRYSNGTEIGLRDIATGLEYFGTYRTTLPENVAKIRKVSAGVNKRTLDKVNITVAAAKAKPVQPEGEFQNILDVPEEPTEISLEPLYPVKIDDSDTITEEKLSSVGWQSSIKRDTMNSKIKAFLKKKGFIPHPKENHKMILPFNERGGIIVFECGSFYEVLLGYLSNGDICPEFIFSGLDSETLIQNFDKMKNFIERVFYTLIQDGYWDIMVNKNIKVYIVTNENMDILGVYSNIKAAKACVADDPKFRKYTLRILQTEYDPTFENEFIKEPNKQNNVEKNVR